VGVSSFKATALPARSLPVQPGSRHAENGRHDDDMPLVVAPLPAADWRIDCQAREPDVIVRAGRSRLLLPKLDHEPEFLPGPPSCCVSESDSLSILVAALFANLWPLF
jgi:hypothetical protein